MVLLGVRWWWDMKYHTSYSETLRVGYPATPTRTQWIPGRVHWHEVHTTTRNWAKCVKTNSTHIDSSTLQHAQNTGHGANVSGNSFHSFFLFKQLKTALEWHSNPHLQHSGIGILNIRLSRHPEVITWGIGSWCQQPVFPVGPQYKVATVTSWYLSGYDFRCCKDVKLQQPTICMRVTNM